MVPSWPRCWTVSLQRAHALGVDVLACPRCHGLWLDGETSVQLFGRITEPAASGPHEDALCCPTCTHTLAPSMIRGISLQRCPAHGVWLDHTQLDRVMHAHAVRHDASLATAGITATNAAMFGGAAVVTAVPLESRLQQANDTGVGLEVAVDATVAVLEGGTDVLDSTDGLVDGLGDVIGAVFELFS